MVVEGGRGGVRGRQGLSHEEHMVHETVEGGGTQAAAASCLIVAVGFGINDDVAKIGRRRRRRLVRIGDFAIIETFESEKECDGESGEWRIMTEGC